MRSFVEKISRKTSQVAYRLGFFHHRGTDATTVSPGIDPAARPFVFRYHPYHFILPEQIRQDFVFTAEQIPVRYYKDKGEYVNPLYPAYWGLIHCNQYEKGIERENAHTVIVSMSDYLISNSRVAGGKMFFDYMVDHPRVALQAPWISGLSQALAASLFARAHVLNPGAGYLTAAERSARVLITSVREGGVLDQILGSQPWIEEYPTTPPIHVLNGCLFGLVALTDCVQQGIVEFIPHMHQIVQSILTGFQQYQSGSHLLYDLSRKQFCNPHYMGLHALLMYQLWVGTGEQQFLALASGISDKADWALYMRSIHRIPSPGDYRWIQDHLTH